MNPFFIWLIKSSAGIALFYLLFRLILRNDNRHSLNRFLLIGILAFSSLVPFIQLPVNTEKPVARPVVAIREFFESEIIEIQNSDIQVFTETDPVQHARFNLSEINWMLVFYLAIISLLVFNLTLSAIRLTQLIRNAERKGFQHFILSVVNGFIQPFSFLNHIVMSKTDFEKNSEFIIAHECEHIRRAHSVDLIVCEIFLLLHWFNPAMWFLRRDLKLIHEFEADEALLKKGIDAPKYQLLVLEKAVGERRFAMANHFFQKPILRRLKMMNRNQKTRWSGVKLLLFLPLALLMLQAFNKPEMKILPDPIFSPSAEEDSTKVWVERWVTRNVALMEEFELTYPHLPTRKTTEFGAVVDNHLEDGITLSFNSQNLPNQNSELKVLQNRKNELLVNNHWLKPEDLKNLVKQFIEGSPIKGIKPDFKEKPFASLDKIKINQGYIVYGKDRDTDQEAYTATFRSFAEAYLEIRKKFAEEKFGEDYFSLPEMKRLIINDIVPINISIAIPKNISSSMFIDLRKDGTIKQDGKVYSFEEFKTIFPKKYEYNKTEYLKMGTKKPFEVIVNDQSAKEEGRKLLMDYFNNNGFKNIHFTSKMPPPPIPPLKITLNENGTITFWDKVYTMEEFGKMFPEKYKSLSESNLKSGHKNPILVSITTFPVVPSKSLLELKEILRKTNVKHVNFSSGTEEKSKGKTSVNVDEVDEKPIFPGGEKELNKFFKDNIVVPEQAKDHFVIEKVYISFTLTKTGKVSNAKIHRGVQPDLDNEALRVVNSFPDWQPGKMKGKAVDVEMIIPVYFFNIDNEDETFKGDPEKHVFSKIKNMPEFPGGEIALRNFITSNLEYPKEAEENGIQGKIYVKFIVKKTGKVTSVGIEKGVEPFLDKEAIRIVNLMPDWKPGLFNGKPVDVYSTVFINFVIKSQPFIKHVKTFNVSPNEKLLIVNGKEYQKNFATIPFDAIESINEIKFPFENTSTYINNPKAKNGVLEIFLRNTINSEIELRKFIANNIKYPKEGFEKKIQGKVKVWVKTNAIGRITDFYKERPQGDKIQISEIIIIGTPKPNSTEIKSESFDIFSNALINVLKKTPLISNNILQDKILEISANFILE